MAESTKEKTYTYRGYSVHKKYRQWYSISFGGSFTTRKDFRDYIDAGIARGKLLEQVS